MIIFGDCLEKMKEMSENSVDAVVTDPPYGLKFMGKKWDYGVPNVEIWREAFRVIKPGANLVSFGGTRTYHRMVVNIEDAGFEIRDQIQWLYGSGFPKSQNISIQIDKQAGAMGDRGKAFVTAGQDGREDLIGTRGIAIGGHEPITDLAKQWEGWGTALKPANEPIVLARKPLEKGLTVAQNVAKWGVGGLNIDASRIATDDKVEKGRAGRGEAVSEAGKKLMGTDVQELNTQGRWPANLILDETAAALLGEPSRFFYVAKASKRERNAGLDGFDSANVKHDTCEESTELARLILKVMSELIPNSSIVLSGENTMVIFPKGCSSTIRTMIQRITELKTWNLLMLLPTSDSMRDAVLKLTDGISHVNSVESSNALTTAIGILHAKVGSVTAGAKLATLEKLLKLSESDAWKTYSSNHPTVKPTKLMEYLIRLITPAGGIVLDPFMGSGSTGVAAFRLGFQFIGIEMNEEYCEIAKRRIESA